MSTPDRETRRAALIAKSLDECYQRGCEGEDREQSCQKDAPADPQTWCDTCLIDALQREIREQAERIATLTAQVEQGNAEATRQYADMLGQRDAAYTERNRIVAFLARLWPSHTARHPDDDAGWDREWMTIVCIHSPCGQLTWHIHDSERHLFEGLPEGENHWDGHSTPEKYRRLGEASAQVEQQAQEIARLTAERDDSRSDLDALSQHHNDETAGLRAEIARLRDQRDRLQTELLAAQTRSGEWIPMNRS